MSTCKISIPGGWIARKLWADCHEQVEWKRVAMQERQQIAFTLRRCGFKRATGGVSIIWRDNAIPAEFSNARKGQRYVRKNTPEKMQRALNAIITRAMRQSHAERQRVAAVVAVDEAAKPLLSDDRFMRCIEMWEKRDGKDSDYTTMTAEEAAVWLKRIADYKAGKATFDVNPSGRAGAAWAI